MNAVLPAAQLRVDRRIVLADRTVHVHESVENLSASDRPIGWTQHVTLGPPFLEKGATEFRASATRSRVFEGVVGPDDGLVPAPTSIGHSRRSEPEATRICASTRPLHDRAHTPRI